MRDLLVFWAKSDPVHPLLAHMLDVGHVATALLENSSVFSSTADRFAHAANCPTHYAIPWLATLSALHDLGKCSPQFQGRHPHLAQEVARLGLNCSHLGDSTFRHEAMSGAWIGRHLRNNLNWTPPSAVTIADALAGHHGRFQERGPDYESTEDDAWHVWRQRLAEAVFEQFQPPRWQASFTDHSVIGLLLSGLIVLADWIASNPELFPHQWRGSSVDEYSKVSFQQAQETVRRLQLVNRQAWPKRPDFRDLWPTFTSLRPIQQLCVDLTAQRPEPGLVIIEAEMGQGKTEAALYLASRWLGLGAGSGLYMAMPTAATSNQMFERLHELLHQLEPTRGQSLQLVHGTSWLIDDIVPEQVPEVWGEAAAASIVASEWFRPRKRSLLAPYGVGTIDQALMSVLHVKFGFLRLFGLAGKILIIDEVHAYDPYMSEIFVRLLAWCRALSIPVILLSATLPQLRRQQLVTAYAPGVRLQARDENGLAPYPLVTYVPSNASSSDVWESPSLPATLTKQVEVNLCWGLLESYVHLAERLVARIQDGGCLCVLTNTVDGAQAAYRAVKERLHAAGLQHVQLFLFHARFPVVRRQELEAAVLRAFDKRSLLPDRDPAKTKRPAAAIVIGTQVLEQSLDLDFDEMYTEVAPIDLLLQRSGRVQRHLRAGRRGPAQLHVMLPKTVDQGFGRSERVYHRYILLRTVDVLNRHPSWSLPADLRMLVEHVYDDRNSIEIRVSPNVYEQAQKEWSQRTTIEAEQAKKYLVPEPSERAFKLARDRRHPYDDDDGEAHSYLAARTRLGDNSVRVLLSNNSQFEKDLNSRRPPTKKRLRTLYAHTVNIPQWWLQNAEPASGYEAPYHAPSWLPGVLVLPLRSGVWKGLDQAGNAHDVIDDPEYGLVYRRATCTDTLQ